MNFTLVKVVRCLSFCDVLEMNNATFNQCAVNWYYILIKTDLIVIWKSYLSINLYIL